VATTLDRTITVPGDAESVFDFVADFSTTEQWDPGIVAATKTSAGPVGLGAEFELMASFMGRKLRTEYRIIEYERPQRVVIRGGTAQFTSTDTIIVTPAEGAVRIDYRAVFELRGAMRLAEPFLKGTFSRLADAAVAGLERRLSR